MTVERSEVSGIRNPNLLHWSSILAGAFVSLAVWIFLYALGAAINGASFPGEKINAWTAVYTLAAPIISFYFGGLVAARESGVINRTSNAYHALVVWAFGIFLGTLLFGAVGGFLAGSMAHAAAGSALTVPSGYAWAIAGSIFGSLLTCLAGGVSVSPERHAMKKFYMSRREGVHP